LPRFAAARTILDEIIPRAPRALWPRVLLSQVLLFEGKDWESAEAALCDVLAIDPNDPTAAQNLTRLLKLQGRGPEFGTGAARLPS
jgi:hypothetical protein